MSKGAFIGCGRGSKIRVQKWKRFLASLLTATEDDLCWGDAFVHFGSSIAGWFNKVVQASSYRGQHIIPDAYWFQETGSLTTVAIMNKRTKAEQFRKARNNFFKRGYKIGIQSDAEMFILIKRKDTSYTFSNTSHPFWTSQTETVRNIGI